MHARIIVGNALGLALIVTALGGFVVAQKDKAAARPASEKQVTQYRLDYARIKAKARQRFLLVEFGADWCEDCIVLARNLDSGATRDYFEDHFDLLRIDIGHSDRNFEAADELGLDLSHGIPAVVVFAPDGSKLGVTNNGELESARNYSSKQILRFLQRLAEGRVITSPAVFN